MAPNDPSMHARRRFVLFIEHKEGEDAVLPAGQEAQDVEASKMAT